MNKEYFSYNKVTGEFVGKGIAEESPLEPGVYHVPANATFDPVPFHDPAQKVALYRPEFWPTGVPKEQGGEWRLMDIVQAEPVPAEANVEEMAVV